MWWLSNSKVVRDRFIRRPRLLFKIGVRETFSHIDNQAAATVAIALLVAFTVILILPQDNAALLKRFIPEHLNLYGIVDSQPQRTAFLIFLFMIGLGGLAYPILARARLRSRLRFEIFRRTGGSRKFKWPKLPLAVVAVMLFVFTINVAQDPWLLSGAAFLATAVLIGRHSRTVSIVWAVTVALVVLAILPGWIGTPIPQPKHLFWYDIHYAGVLSHGERLAAGHLLYVDNAPTYSLIIPIAIAMAALGDHVPTIGDLVRVVQGGQTLCLFAILMAAWLLTRNSPGLGRALAVFCVALASVPFVNGLGPAIWTPNQSGLRFFMVPIAVIVAYALERMGPRGGAALVGLTAGTALLYNTETGLAITGGLGLAWLISVRGQSLVAAVGSAALGLAAMVGVFGVVAVLYHAAFGGWPFPTSRETANNQIGLFAGGYGALPLKPRLLALLILGHSSYLVVRALGSLVSPEVKSPSISSTAIAGILLVWFPYWLNRSADWNLWTYIVLYALLLAPAIAAQGRRLIPLTVAGLLVLPMSLISAKFNLIDPLTRERWIAGWHTGCGDGLILSPRLCTHLQRRATTLKDEAADGEAVWITSLPMLTMRMTGMHGPFPTIDLFNAAPTTATFDRLVGKIQEIQPRTILIDLPDDGLIEVPQQVQAFHRRLLGEMGWDDCPSRAVGGWSLFEVGDDCLNDPETY